MVLRIVDRICNFAGLFGPMAYFLSKVYSRSKKTQSIENESSKIEQEGFPEDAIASRSARSLHIACTSILDDHDKYERAKPDQRRL
jgi:hypothetical protein